MSKNAEPTPQGGVHSVQNWNRRGGNHADWGRPELESYTPVNIGNGPYRDNGEGVAATPLPYPLSDGRNVVYPTKLAVLRISSLVIWVLALGLFPAGAAEKFANSDCLDCHLDPTTTRK